MLIRILSVAAIAVLVVLAVQFYGARADGLEPKAFKTITVAASMRVLPPLLFVVAALLTALALFKATPKLLLAGGVALLGGALIVEPNFAIWFGLMGDGLFEPLRSGRDALVVAGAAVWLLLLSGARREAA